jgi:hypothetical protein
MAREDLLIGVVELFIEGYLLGDGQLAATSGSALQA